MAPETEQSGASHSLTLTLPLRLRERHPQHGALLFRSTRLGRAVINERYTEFGGSFNTAAFARVEVIDVDQLRQHGDQVRFERRPIAHYDDCIGILDRVDDRLC